MQSLTPKREVKFRRAVHCAQANLTVVLEDVHDPHNIGAVLRTCDSIGVREIYVLYTRIDAERLKLGRNAAAGSRKWVDVHFFTDPEACFKAIRAKYDKIYGTHLGTGAKSPYELDLTESVALVFGNERDGLRAETLKELDGNLIIPQVGMAESLNISVACAVTLYEAFRQRKEKGFYDDNPVLSADEQEVLYQEYKRRHHEGSHKGPKYIYKSE